MSMTRQDYVMIAAVLAGYTALPDDAGAAARCAARAMAEMLGRTNANFDKARFLKACGL